MGTVKWTHFVTGRDDATLWNLSVLSRPAEWHALAVGVLAVIAPDVFVAVAPPELQSLVVGIPFVGLGGAYAAGRGLRKFADTLHWKDALREPAYTVAGVVSAVGVLTLIQFMPWG